MLKPRLFGFPSRSHVMMAQRAGFHSSTFFLGVMDRNAMWDPLTMNLIVECFPLGLLLQADLHLILSECIANATQHGEAEALSLHARRRGSILLLSFFQIPPMIETVPVLLSQSSKDKLPDLMRDDPGGLGFPILLRLARRVTITSDLTRLQLWFSLKSA